MEHIPDHNVHIYFACEHWKVSFLLNQFLRILHKSHETEKPPPRETVFKHAIFTEGGTIQYIIFSWNFS